MTTIAQNLTIKHLQNCPIFHKKIVLEITTTLDNLIRIKIFPQIRPWKLLKNIIKCTLSSLIIFLLSTFTIRRQNLNMWLKSQISMASPWNQIRSPKINSINVWLNIRSGTKKIYEIAFFLSRCVSSSSFP